MYAFRLLIIVAASYVAAFALTCAALGDDIGELQNVLNDAVWIAMFLWPFILVPVIAADIGAFRRLFRDRG